MGDLILVSSYISCFLSLLCFFILLTKNKIRIYMKVLILSCIMCCSISIFFWIFFQGIIPLLDNAQLWVISFPVYLLPGTLLYLYIRTIIVKSRRTFRKSDLLHFLPFFLAIVSVVRFFLHPANLQRHSLELYLLHPNIRSEGSLFFLAINQFLILIFSIWTVYLFLSLRLVWRSSKRKKEWIAKHSQIWLWVKMLTLINLLGFIFFLLLFTCLDTLAFSKIWTLPVILFIAGTTLFVMFNPKILYGHKNPIIEQLPKSESSLEMLSKSLELSPLKISEYRERTISFMNEEKVFLKKNYSLKEMADDLDIPLHHLSFVINKEFGTNYANFINKFRIDFIIEHRFDEKWSHYSLEGLSAEAGFNSRSTFFKAFKLATGTTPSDYFSNKV